MLIAVDISEGKMKGLHMQAFGGYVSYISMMGDPKAKRLISTK